MKRLHSVLHPQELTISEVLKSAGYATGIIGKWHQSLANTQDPSGWNEATMPNAQGFNSIRPHH